MKKKFENEKQKNKNFSVKGHIQFRVSPYLHEIMYVICKYCDILPFVPDMENNIWNKGACYYFDYNGNEIENKYELLKRYILYNEDMTNKTYNFSKESLKNYYLFLFCSIAELFKDYIQRGKEIEWNEKDYMTIYIYEKLFSFHLFHMESNIIINRYEILLKQKQIKIRFPVELEYRIGMCLPFMFNEDYSGIFRDIYKSNGIFQRCLIAKDALIDFTTLNFINSTKKELFNYDIYYPIQKKIKKTNRRYLESEYQFFKEMKAIGVNEIKPEKFKINNLQYYFTNNITNKNFYDFGFIEFYNEIFKILCESYSKYKRNYLDRKVLKGCVDKYIKSKEFLYITIIPHIIKSSINSTTSPKEENYRRLR